MDRDKETCRIFALAVLPARHPFDRCINESNLVYCVKLGRTKGPHCSRKETFIFSHLANQNLVIWYRSDHADGWLKKSFYPIPLGRAVSFGVLAPTTTIKGRR